MTPTVAIDTRAAGRHLGLLVACALLGACGGGGDGGSGEDISRLYSQPAVAGPTLDPVYPWVDSAVQMQARCEGRAPFVFDWDYGDGRRDRGIHAATAHTFAPRTGGRYPITITCHDEMRSSEPTGFTLELYQRNLSVLARADCQGAFAGHGWCRQHPAASGPLFRQVFALDADTLWGIGRDGTVLRARTDHTQGEHLQRVRAFSASSGSKAWAAHDGGIAVTTDGDRGIDAHWTTLWPILPATPPAPASGGTSAPPATPRVPVVRVLDAVDANTVWALADDGILRTGDAGKSWVRTAWSASGKQATTLFAANATSAWVVGKAGLIESTRDAGKTWRAEAPAVAASGAEYTAAASSRGRSVAWLAAADGTVLQLAFASNAWTRVREPRPPGAPPERIQSIALRDGGAWLAGQRNVSTTGTSTLPVLWRVSGVGSATVRWFDVPMGNLDSTLRSVSPYRGDAAWVAGDRALYRVVAEATPEVFYKLDGNVQTLRSFSAATPSVAWTIGDGRRVMRSTDGGQTWSTRAGLADRDFKSVLAIDANTAWAVAGTGDLYRTIDGAAASASWVAQTPASGIGALQLVAAAGTSPAAWRAGTGAAWAAGAAGTVLRTTDSGATWAAPPCGLGADLSVSRLASRSPAQAWVVAQAASAPSRQLLRVGDGGAGCGPVALPQAADVQDVALGGDSEVWVLGRQTGAGSPTALWRSWNGGAFQRLPLPQIAAPLSLAGGTNARAWIATPSAIWKVWFDGGNLRAVRQADLGADLQPLLSLQWLDNQTLWGAGVGGQVWKTLTGGDHLGSLGPKPGQVGPP